MTALSATRLTKSRWLGETHAYLAADSLTFYHGGLVMLDSAGLLRPAAALAGNQGCVGMAELTPAGGFLDGSKASGTGGDVWIPVREGLFSYAGATLEQEDVGKLVYAADDQTIDETPTGAAGAALPIVGPLIEYVGASEGYVYVSWKRAQQEKFGYLSWYMDLTLVADGDLITTVTPGFTGIVTSLEAHVVNPVTTAAKLSTLNAEIGTTNVTGDLAITSANMTPLGAVVAQALSGANFFGPADTVSIEAASTTTFIEGAIMIVLQYKQLGF